MAAQKFTDFDKFFLMHAGMTVVTYNLTKLFRMKLKTTKTTRAIIQKKLDELFGQLSAVRCLMRAAKSHRKERGCEHQGHRGQGSVHFSCYCLHLYT